MRLTMLLSTWFGVGLMRFAPGTWGSAAAMPFAALIAWAFGPLALIPAGILVFLVGVWASGHYARDLGISDPGSVVIDEVAGQFLTLALVPLDPVLYLVGFFVFRVLDVVKPFPANWADRELHGGWGIMTDDVIAGIYGALIMWGIDRWLL